MSSVITAGQVIFLKGASSSGKTSIATELLDVLDRPWFHLSVDAFNAMRARRQTRALGADELTVLRRTRAVSHRAVTGMALGGGGCRGGPTWPVRRQSCVLRVPAPGSPRGPRAPDARRRR
jgi:hypothetical protein